MPSDDVGEKCTIPPKLGCSYLMLKVLIFFSKKMHTTLSVVAANLYKFLGNLKCTLTCILYLAYLYLMLRLKYDVLQYVS